MDHLLLEPLLVHQLLLNHERLADLHEGVAHPNLHEKKRERIEKAMNCDF